MPVLLLADLTDVDPETGQLRQLAQRAFEFGESRELGEPDHVVPQRDRVVRIGEAADHRPEERGALRRLEMQDGGAHVASGEGKSFVGLGAHLLVESVIVERADQVSRKAGVGQ